MTRHERALAAPSPPTARRGHGGRCGGPTGPLAGRWRRGVAGSLPVLTAALLTAVPMALTAAAAPAAAATTTTTTTSALSLWLESDTNPGRIAGDALNDDEAPLAVVPDALVRAASTAAVDVLAPRMRVHADVAGGGKLFFTAASERMVVGALRAAAVVALDDVTTVLAQGSAKLRAQRSGARTYGALRIDAAVERALAAGWSCRLGAAGVAFEAVDEPLFSSAGGSPTLGLGWRAGRERIDLLADVGPRVFPAAPREPGVVDDSRRLDLPASLTISATSARPLFLHGAVTAMRNDSNARGEAFTRLRAQGALGVRLPAAVTATAQLAAQWTAYDDGVSLGQRYFLDADDETQNVAELALTRALWGGLAVDARVRAFSNELSAGGARFARTTAAIGLRAALW
jgi:hypothetical protein